MLVDTHCHLDFPDFADDLDAVVARAEQAGVTRMVSISTRMRTFPPIRDIAERFPNVYCTLGVHPHNSGEDGEGVSVADLVAATKHPKVVGIGETGLDYFYDKSPRDKQEEGFRRHIRACLETGLPLIVHTRDAEEDTMRILRDEAEGRGLKGVMHCFSSRKWLAEQALAFGFYISFSGIVTFKKSEELREVAAMVPLDRILVETDAPYLAPVPNRGKRNEPAFVVDTAKVVAEAKGVSFETLAKHATANSFAFFHKMAA